MKLLYLSLLSLLFLPLSAGAANVQYSLFIGTDPTKNVIFSFVSPDFLTNLPPTTDPQRGFSAWFVPLNQTTVLPHDCQFRTCGPIRLIGGSKDTDIYLSSLYLDGTAYYDDVIISADVPFGLGQIGIGGYPNGGLSLAVQYTDHVATYDPVPEPGTFALAGLAFCFFAPTIVGAVRRRFNSTSRGELAASPVR